MSKPLGDIGPEAIGLESGVPPAQPMPVHFRLELLDGREIRKLVGREMALDDDGPEWTHPAVPCLQLVSLFFCLDNGYTVSLCAFYNDDGAEFLLEECEQPECEQPELYQGDQEEIFRTRVLDEFEGGLFRSIKTEGESGVELWHIQVGHREIVLVAAEVEAQGDGYRFQRPDETILLFSPPDRIHLVDWNQPRMMVEKPGFALNKAEAQAQHLERKLGGWPSARTDL